MSNKHPNFKIPESSFVHHTSVIYDNVTIEPNVHIGPCCIIGSPAEYKGREHMTAGVHICEGSRITGMVTVDSGTTDMTYIGRNAYIMKHAHIGHDAYIGDDVTISCGVKVGGHCHVHDRVNIGLNAVLHQYVVVPEDVMIGASAFVGLKTFLNKGYKYAGVPAKELGLNIRKPQVNVNHVDDQKIIDMINKQATIHYNDFTTQDAFYCGASWFWSYIKENKHLI